MRLIKMFSIVLVGMFAVITIIGLLIPSSAKVSRGIIVNADSSNVYKELSDVKNWNQWLPWITADSGAVVQTSAVTNAPGAYFKWKGVKLNSAGTLTIQSIKPNEILLLHEIKDMNTSEGGLRIRSISNNTTEVLWYMEYKLKWYPWERFFGIFIDKIIGSAFEQGLEQFRTYTEQKYSGSTTTLTTEN